MVAPATSTPDMEEPCMAMASPTPRTFEPLTCFLGYFPSHPIMSLTLATQRSRAQLSAVSP